MRGDSARRCEHCGYDLRGIRSKLCPECGLGRSMRLRIAGAREYHAARAAFEHVGILRSCIDPAGLIDFINNSASSAGYLCILETDLDSAEELLEQHGIAFMEEQTAFVRADDPRCPACEGEFRSIGDAECLLCGQRVHWIEAHDDIGPSDDVVCPTCMDEVTLVDFRCPKCGTSFGQERDDSPRS